MSRGTATLLSLGLVLAAACGCGDALGARPSSRSGIRLAVVATGFDHPVHLASPPGDPRLFVVEQGGLIRIVRDGRILDRPFLDLRNAVSTGNERGLLSMAFHPDFGENGMFFVNYTDRSGDSRIDRLRTGANPDRADPESRRLVLRIPQPYRNHNGGHLLFGPDGMLWIPTGDGGSGGDPQGNGQRLDTLLGKLLRIDVTRGDPYDVPDDNPYVGRRDARPEIWAHGLRNPWRIAFDPPTGRLYVADVGQDRWEEISVAPADSAGIDYGWAIMEGDQCFRDPDCDRRGLLGPIVTYGHREGCSVIGGEVYRGRLAPALAGHYVFADYCKGWIRSFRFDGAEVADYAEWDVPRVDVSSFGHDGRGELYVVAHAGTVYRVEASGPAR